MELHGQSGGAAALALRDGTESVCLSFFSDDPGLTAYWGDPGCRLPLHTTATGMVLLANAGGALQDEICAGPLRAYTSATITNGTTLRDHLSKIRCDGYAMVCGSLREGRGAIAAPVRDARGLVVASVGVVGPLDMLQPSRLAPLVMATAEAVSRQDRTEGWRMAGVGA